jgi:hypothetical protein
MNASSLGARRSSKRDAPRDSEPAQTAPPYVAIRYLARGRRGRSRWSRATQTSLQQMNEITFWELEEIEQRDRDKHKQEQL